MRGCFGGGHAVVRGVSTGVAPLSVASTGCRAVFGDGFLDGVLLRGCFRRCGCRGPSGARGAGNAAPCDGALRLFRIGGVCGVHECLLCCGRCDDARSFFLLCLSGSCLFSLKGKGCWCGCQNPAPALREGVSSPPRPSPIKGEGVCAAAPLGVGSPPSRG